jgi:hypothetical protein
MSKRRLPKTEAEAMHCAIKEGEGVVRELMRHGIKPAQMMIHGNPLRVRIYLQESRRNQKLANEIIGRSQDRYGRHTNHIAKFGNVDVLWTETENTTGVTA